jgi:hypothetical protein
MPSEVIEECRTVCIAVDDGGGSVGCLHRRSLAHPLLNGRACHRGVRLGDLQTKKGSEIGVQLGGLRVPIGIGARL